MINMSKNNEEENFCCQSNIHCNNYDKPDKK